jgi:hypothetical protein
LTQEIEARLQRTLEEDRPKDDHQIRIERGLAEIAKWLVWQYAPTSAPLAGAEARGLISAAAARLRDHCEFIPEPPLDTAQGEPFAASRSSQEEPTLPAPMIGLDQIAARLRVSRRTVQRRMAQAGIGGTGRGRPMMLTEEDYGRLIEACRARSARAA